MSGFKVNTIKSVMMMSYGIQGGYIMAYLDRVNDVKFKQELEEMRQGQDNDLKRAISNDGSKAEIAFNAGVKQVGA